MGENAFDRVLVVVGFARRNFKRLVITPLTVMVIVALLSLLLKNKYEARTVFVPPKQGEDLTSLLLGQMGGVGGIAAGAAGIKVKDPNEVFVGFLKSRNIRDTMVSRFKLMEHYKAEHRSEASFVLMNRTRIQAGVDGMVSVSVTDQDKVLAANMANAYIEVLNVFLAKMGREESGTRRKFYESQLAAIHGELAFAERNLREFLKKKGMLNFDATAQINVQQTAMLQAEISGREIAIMGLSGSMSSENPRVKQLASELSALRTQLKSVQAGDREALGSSELVDAGSEYFRLFREVKYREILVEVMIKQFELAKLDEARGGSLAQIVDRAYPPEKKSGPSRALITLGAGVLAFLFSVLWAISLEERYLEKIKEALSVERVRGE